MRRNKEIVAVVACIALIAAACGGDDDDGGRRRRRHRRRRRNRADGTEAPAATGARGHGGTADAGDRGTTAATEARGATPARRSTRRDRDRHRRRRRHDHGRHAGRPVRRLRSARHGDRRGPEGVLGRRSTPTAASPAARSSSSSRTTRYDVADAPREVRDRSSDEVAIFSQSTGSPHTAAIAQDLVDDDLIAIPLSWYSGWADPEIGENVLRDVHQLLLRVDERHRVVRRRTATCRRSRSSRSPASTAGRRRGRQARRRGSSGSRSSTTARPGDAAVGRQPEPRPDAVISQIVAANPDLVWATINPTTLAAIMGGAVGQGFTRACGPATRRPTASSCSAPSWRRCSTSTTSPRRTSSRGAPTCPAWPRWSTTMTAARPDLAVSDVYILGWTEGDDHRGDPRAGRRERRHDAGRHRGRGQGGRASTSTGLAPDQTWAGEPNDFIVRESYIYDVDARRLQPGHRSARAADRTGWELLEGPYVERHRRRLRLHGALLRLGLID